MPNKLIPSFTRTVHIEALIDLITDRADTHTLAEVFDKQDVSIALSEQPNTLLLWRDYIGLYARAAQVTNAPNLGLLETASSGFSRLGPYGSYVTSAPTLLHALERARNTLSFHENASHFGFQPEGGDIKVFYYSTDQEMLGWRHIADRCLYLLRDIVRCFLGMTWNPHKIEVSYRPGPWRQHLEESFGASTEFDKHAVAVYVPKDFLNTPNLQPNETEDPKVLDELMALGKMLPSSFAEALRELIRQRLLNGKTDIKGAAMKLGLTERTLQRRLRDNNSSYRKLLSACTADLAEKLLTETDTTDVQIALMLGYSSEAHFIRAFKRNKGLAPGRFRKAYKNANSVH